MLFIQLTGLSGAGKTTIAHGAKDILTAFGYRVQVVDGDDFRKTICRDLGFSKQDRMENIRRMGFVASLLSSHGVITILSAINPYEEVRREMNESGDHVRTVWIRCDMQTLRNRDPKGLYHKAFLPESDPEKITNLTGVNDPYEPPLNPELILDTDRESEAESIQRLVEFIKNELSSLHRVADDLPGTATILKERN